MHITPNPFIAMMAGMTVAYAAWLSAWQEASVREAFRNH